MIECTRRASGIATIMYFFWNSHHYVRRASGIATIMYRFWNSHYYVPLLE
jgi:hypothetical protein